MSQAVGCPFCAPPCSSPSLGQTIIDQKVAFHQAASQDFSEVFSEVVKASIVSISNRQSTFFQEWDILIDPRSEELEEDEVVLPGVDDLHFLFRLH